jgi:hypothetical protein
MPKLSDPIWQKHFDDLVVFARKNLGNLPQRMKDEEDIAASAIKSYFNGIEQGRFQLPQDDGFPLAALVLDCDTEMR